MESLEQLINQVRGGDEQAYAAVVARFQDMAVGYAYALLGNFQSAEDAAQEAFFEAFRKLESLREPLAFPGWFRRIVFKHCDRITRAKSQLIVTLDMAMDVASENETQAESMERSERQNKIWKTIDFLPRHQRSTVLLYYISGYSHKEISEFLDVPVSTIKKRLYSARNKLRELLEGALEDTLRERRPSRNEAFASRLMNLLTAARLGDSTRVKQVIEDDPRLRVARDPLGNTALVVAVNAGHKELAELLLSSGYYLDIHEAAAIGNTQRVSELIVSDPSRIDSFSPEGFTALALASHFGHEETTALLLNSAANVNALSKNKLGVTALHAALFGSKVGTAKLLINRGADVNIRRGGKNSPRAGWTALHYAAANGFLELIGPLCEQGADLDATDCEGRTPLDIALEQGQGEVAAMLGRHPDRQ